MNPFLRALGFGPADRVVIIHPDDIGMCHATLPAFAELVAFGLISSATTMVSCPWFPAVAAFCRAHPEVDMGVHLTLASEWDVYRWKPLTTNDPASGLLDAEGYCHRGPRGVWAAATRAAVETEIEAQLARGLAAGIDVTHLDSHMDTLVHPTLMPAYAGLARRYQLPPLVVGLHAERFLARGFDAETAAAAEREGQELAETGLLVVDDLQMPSLDDPTDRVGACKRIIDALKPGLSVLRIHPAVDTPELRAMAPDWRCRVADYEAFMSPELRDYIGTSGVHVIGYRVLRDVLRAGL